MPAQETLNPSAQVPSFSVVERYRHLWVWLEDPTLADRAVIPEMGQLDSKNMRDRFPGFSGRVDRWQIIHYTYPSTICIDVGVVEAGTGAFEGDRSRGVNGYVMNTTTPEHDRTWHYFWAFMRNYRLESWLLTTQLRNGVDGVFGEEEAMLKAQQDAIDANPDYEFYNLNIVAGSMWVRRLLERALEAEGCGAAGPRVDAAATGAPAPIGG